MAARNVIAGIKEGMPVLDSGGKRIGVVEEVYFGTGSDEAEDYTTASRGGPDPSDMTPDAADPGVTDPDLPDVLRNRLLTRGYIKIDTGIFGDNFAMADQVAEVVDNTVRLTVTEDQLVH